MSARAIQLLLKIESADKCTAQDLLREFNVTEGSLRRTISLCKSAGFIDEKKTVSLRLTASGIKFLRQAQEFKTESMKLSKQ